MGNLITEAQHPVSSHDTGDMWYQHDLSLVMLTLITWLLHHRGRIFLRLRLTPHCNALNQCHWCWEGTVPAQRQEPRTKGSRSYPRQGHSISSPPAFQERSFSPQQESSRKASQNGVQVAGRKGHSRPGTCTSVGSLPRTSQQEQDLNQTAVARLKSPTGHRSHPISRQNDPEIFPGP